MDHKELTAFLVRAKYSAYATITDAKKTILSDDGTELNYKEARLTYRDRYYGGEPYIGEEVVILDNTVIWGMNYRGKVVVQDVLPTEKVYAFLQESLRSLGNDAPLPLRGPLSHSCDEMCYTTISNGSLENFSGVERIFFGDQVIYEGYFHGGTVGKRQP